jgi:hypothetical protein
VADYSHTHNYFMSSALLNISSARHIISSVPHIISSARLIISSARLIISSARHIALKKCSQPGSGPPRHLLGDQNLYCIRKKSNLATFRSVTYPCSCFTILANIADKIIIHLSEVIACVRSMFHMQINPPYRVELNCA